MDRSIMHAVHPRGAPRTPWSARAHAHVVVLFLPAGRHHRPGRAFAPSGQHAAVSIDRSPSYLSYPARDARARLESISCLSPHEF